MHLLVVEVERPAASSYGHDHAQPRESASRVTS